MQEKLHYKNNVMVAAYSGLRSKISSADGAKLGTSHLDYWYLSWYWLAYW